MKKKRGKKREAFIQQLGRHKGGGVASIGVALTWLNSSSGVSLVMSLIPQTSHAPFTTSHTKLNTKLKKKKHTHTQTAGRKCDRFKIPQKKKKEEEQIALRYRAERVRRYQPRCPSVLPACLPVGSPNFSHKTGIKNKKNNKKNQPRKIRLKHFSPKEPGNAEQPSRRITCLPEASQDNCGGKKKKPPSRPPEPKLPDTEPNSALEKNQQKHQ